MAEPTYTVRSPYRPFTRNAYAGLKEHNILEEVETENCISNEITVAERPADKFLEKHELQIQNEPSVIFENDQGSKIQIYTDPNQVIAEGEKTVLHPWVAADELTESPEWEPTKGNPGEFYDPPLPNKVLKNRFLPGSFEFDSVIDRIHTTENAPEPSGPCYVWSRRVSDSDTSKIGFYQSDEYVDDGFPFIVAKLIDPLDDSPPAWKPVGIAETKEFAINMLHRQADFRTFIEESQSGELYPEWLNRTGGTEYEQPEVP